MALSISRIDPELGQYATPRELEHIAAITEHGSQSAAAIAFGIHPAAISRSMKRLRARAALRGYSPDHDMTRTVPDGYQVKGVSSYYGADGELRGQWVKSKIDAERQAEMLQAMIEGLSSTIPRATQIVTPRDPLASDLMACYPVGDHHLGSLSWAEETGDDYDLNIAENLLLRATDHLIDVAPQCETSIIAILGDFFHYDSFDALTPTNHNILDSDTRYPKMVRTATGLVRYMIDAALKRHGAVHVIIEIGNHDLSSSIFLAEFISALYENESRVSVDTSPSHFHYFSFGRVLVGTYHGHRTKMANLPLIMANDRPELWGATDHRYWWTGHVHHEQVKDYVGCRVESFRVLAAADAYTANAGYRSKRDMKAIILHKTFGEVARHTVNPLMLEDAVDATDS